MTLLAVLYWVILVLCALGIWAPPTWPNTIRFGPWVALFVLIGLRVFRISLQ